jgi:hypothetical protein
MAREPTARYQDAGELAEELGRFQAGRLVSAHHYTVAALVSRWIRRHRATFVTVLVALSLLVVLAVWSIRQLLEERDRALRRGPRR